MKAFFFAVTVIVSLSCNSSRNIPYTEKAKQNQQDFWQNLNKICGKSFAGEVVAAPANDTMFKNKSLVMHVRSCTDKTIRVPFMVGEDRSRTWVFTLEENLLQLKHDHPTMVRKTA